MKIFCESVQIQKRVRDDKTKKKRHPDTWMNGNVEVVIISMMLCTQ